MKVLIISDDPERKSFVPILSLRDEIQESGRNKADLLVFSNKGIFLNQEQIGRKADTAVKLLKSVLSEKTYGLIVISLKSSNLLKLFPERRSILDLIKEISPQTDVFLFGASSVLQKLEKERATNTFLFSRPGVSKLTRKFKNDLIDYIKTKKLE